MPSIPRPFASDDADDETFDEYDEFCPDHLPVPGPALQGADVLTGDEHCAFHRLTRDIFEERGVYDATFGYNLARLNLDSRHPDAGWRYARVAAADTAAGEEGAGDADVLLAEFTPTTEFCPQSESLTVGAFRAWNGLSDRHDFDRVSVALAPMHHESTAINEKLRDLEARLDADGEVPDARTNIQTAEGNRELADDADDSSLPF
ncbi:hypothetical protein [Halorussus salinus]|uniref:hypothetical protein n=1 Tax=Halorussus salinus TaxID=1364935 RepID=UPI0010931741|nr:hypothetical protein [Halorussus salinus]